MPAAPEEEYGQVNSFTVHGFGTNHGFISSREVWCDWCMCAIRPGVSFMRQHRRSCRIDPRVVGYGEKD